MNFQESLHIKPESISLLEFKCVALGKSVIELRVPLIGSLALLMS